MCVSEKFPTDAGAAGLEAEGKPEAGWQTPSWVDEM